MAVIAQITASGFIQSWYIDQRTRSTKNQGRRFQAEVTVFSKMKVMRVITYIIKSYREKNKIILSFKRTELVGPKHNKSTPTRKISKPRKKSITHRNPVMRLLQRTFYRISLQTRHTRRSHRRRKIDRLSTLLGVLLDVSGDETLEVVDLHVGDEDEELVAGFLFFVALSRQADAYSVGDVSYALAPQELVQLGCDADILCVHGLLGEVLDGFDGTRGALLEGDAM